MSINDSQRGWRDANYRLAEKHAKEKKGISIDTDAIRQYLNTIHPGALNAADGVRLCTEVDRLTADNKGLITCLKKDVTYKQAVELAKREHEISKLTEQNKLMREVLKKIAKSGQDPFSRKWARDALTTIKGDPK